MKMNVGQAIELAREWAETYGSQTPGFCGAHLMGSLNYAQRDAPFPIYKDVDLNILVQDGPSWAVNDISYKGLILEYGAVNAEAYRSPEIVLSDPRLASNLAVNSILLDPAGLLDTLHKTVAKEYPRRKWVLARCESAKDDARQSLEELSRANSPIEAIFPLGFLMLALAGLIAIAGLKPPTTRRSLVLAKEVLETWGEADLQEEILSVYGCVHLNKPQVEFQLEVCATAFDRAVEVTRTPIPYRYKLHPHVKPYFIDGAKEMIDEGYHREAVLWITAALGISSTAIQIDGLEDEKPAFQLKVNQLLSDLGLITSQDVASRFQRAKALTDRIFKVADTIASQNPKIIE
jgi:hypothetical protein